MKVQVWVCVGKCRIIYPLMQVAHEQIFAFELLGISIYLATFVCLFNLWWPFLLHFLQSSLEGIKSLISSDYEGTIFYISHHPIPSTFWILWWFEKFIRVRIVDKIPFVQKWGKIAISSKIIRAQKCIFPFKNAAFERKFTIHRWCGFPLAAERRGWLMTVCVQQITCYFFHIFG